MGEKGSMATEAGAAKAAEVVPLSVPSGEIASKKIYGGAGLFRNAG